MYTTGARLVQGDVVTDGERGRHQRAHLRRVRQRAASPERPGLAHVSRAGRLRRRTRPELRLQPHGARQDPTADPGPSVPAQRPPNLQVCTRIYRLVLDSICIIDGSLKQVYSKTP